jgi:TRAP-type mannitol/chloroaromatic compound transport system permease small subunit
MASSARILNDSSSLSRIDTVFLRLEIWLGIFSGLAVFSLMLLAVFSVGGRNFLNQPLPGYVDWIEQLMPLIAFMGVSYVQREGGHIRMDILISRLQGRALWSAELLTVSLMLVLMMLLVWGSWAHFERSFDLAMPLWSRDSSMDIALPIWPAKLLVPVAFSVLCVRLSLQACGYALAIINNTAEPVALPLPMDAAAQAAGEAESLLGTAGHTGNSSADGGT